MRKILLLISAIVFSANAFAASARVHIGGTWVEAEDNRVQVGGTWIELEEGYTYTIGDWVKWLEAETGGTVVQVTSGNNFSLFVLSNGQVWSAGDNYYGQLGRNVASGSASSVNLGQITALSGVTSASAGLNFSLFVLSNGQVWSAGANNAGQLVRLVPDGNSSSTNLGQITALSGVTSVSTGSYHSLFVLSNGQVWSAGYNNYGALGRSVSSGSASSVNLGQITTLSNVRLVAAKYNHSLFVLSNGQVWSAGNNAAGQLGRKVASGSESSVNLGQITALSGVTSASGGGSHSLFVLSNGQVWSAGDNYYGQLGRNVASGSASSVNLGQITALSGVTSVVAGNGHSLFVRSNGQVWSSGYNNAGQLARTVNTGSISSINLGEITALSGVTSASGGGSHSLFVLSNGQVWSAGNNAAGQLGRNVASGSESSVNLGRTGEEYFGEPISFVDVLYENIAA